MSMIEIQLFVAIVLLIAILLLLLFRKTNSSNAQLTTDISKLEQSVKGEFSINRTENQQAFKESREELSKSFLLFSENISKNISELSMQQQRQLESFSLQLQQLVKTNEEKIEKLILSNETKQNEFKEQVNTSLTENREENIRSIKTVREEIATSLKDFQETFTVNVKDFNELQRQKFGDMQTRHEQLKTDMETKFEKVRDTIEKKLHTIQEENSKKLEEMRQTVDEKLQSTVEKRFNDSFKLISDRLEQVHKGLGEMQTLATGVGDLKKVLSNVKTRGNLGEIQLGAILEEMFSIEQYEHNATVRSGSQERVEYVIKLPGKNDDNKPLLLPIDSKFPNEDYQRLLDAYDQVGGIDAKALESVNRQFETAVKRCAKDIREKYINPPTTTDFAIMFVPTEGLYAEILRRAGLFEILRRDYRVTVVGPTNLVAFLNSLQMGFRTLAIEKRSSEVWEILGAVKTEFGKFGDVLDKTKKKLLEATNSIDTASVRTRAIERQLRKVQELPQEQAMTLIGQSLASEEEQIVDEEVDKSE
ncbi:hypothetical protein CAP35_12410 [Chitinophagaceae bacterium IBVUCB1]|nr:hypothetical protein CAP35_12410 [Chitinophagaceae bacterium IBVUCB1]